MTRDSRTLSAVFMAVLLVLASGTAVSLAVTGSSTTDAGTNAAAVQETTTEDVVQETTTAEADDGVEETTTREADEPADGDQASVTIDEQESEGEQIVVESATLPEGGFIAIHDASVSEAPLASVLGNSVYLEPGTHEDVTITLARPITESQTLVAMPHLDTNDNQVFDFVLSTGNVDGPYTTDGEIVIDDANVSVPQETTTTTEEAEETTTTEAVEGTTTEEVVDETTTEEVIEETTTEADDGVEETTTEEVVDETTTEEDDAVEETTTTEEVIEETTTEEVDGVDETTTEAPADMEQFVFKIEQMNIDRWSFVVGDEEQPDRTETISDVQISDRRVTINLSEVLRQSQMGQEDMLTTVSPEEAQEQLEENLTQDIQTVRFVIENVQIENVTFVVTAPADMELPEPPTTTTTEEDDGLEETTTEEVIEETTTTEEDDGLEETTTEEVVEETTTEEVVDETTTEEVIEETTTEEVVEETTTTEEDDGVEETTTEEVVEETTTEEVVEETTTAEAADLDSFEVSNLDAPSSADVGDTVEVSATVSNPNDQQASQTVAFRLEGTVLARQEVTLDAGEQTTVTFDVDTTDVPAGQYIHGIYTQDFGELAVIMLEEPSAEETTAAEDDEETTTAEA